MTKKDQELNKELPSEVHAKLRVGMSFDTKATLLRLGISPNPENKVGWSNLENVRNKVERKKPITKAEIEDSFFINAKRYFLQYAKRQSEPIFDIAKRELEHIENNTHSVCEDDDLKKFRTVSKRIQIGVLIEIMGENVGE